jgi:hypothetical protein
VIHRPNEAKKEFISKLHSAFFALKGHAEIFFFIGFRAIVGVVILIRGFVKDIL